MKAGLQKGGKKHQGAGRAGSFNSSEEIQKPLHNTTLPQKYEQHLKGVPWVSILIQEGTWGLFQLKEKLIFFFNCSPCPFPAVFSMPPLSHLDFTRAGRSGNGDLILFISLLMTKVGQQLLQG